MRYGVLADIHGNLHALEAALPVLERAGVDRYICAGDLVGYGPFPNECVEAISNLGAVCVAGNHDLMALDGYRNIEPLGGSKDKGRDAIHVAPSPNGESTVFAYSWADQAQLQRLQAWRQSTGYRRILRCCWRNLDLQSHGH